MYIFKSAYMYATRRCTPGVPTVYPYPQYLWLTQPEGRRVRVLTGVGTGQPGITRGLPVLIPTYCGQSMITLDYVTSLYRHYVPRWVGSPSPHGLKKIRRD